MSCQAPTIRLLVTVCLGNGYTSESGEELFTFDEGRIEFKDVGFEYTPGVLMLKREFHGRTRAEQVAFVGHTGSGKSSITNFQLFRVL